MEQVLPLISSEEKRERTKGVNLLSKLIKAQEVHIADLEQPFIEGNSNTKSSLIQLMCSIDADAVKSLIQWIEKFKETDPACFHDYEENEVGKRLFYSLKKYLRHPSFFTPIFEYVKELHEQSLLLRKELVNDNLRVW
ncbi:hypothetical protein ACWV26_14000 [Rummeliibacillus sp. JY-2-4R]